MNEETPKDKSNTAEPKNNTNVNTFFNIFSKPYLLFFLFWCIFNIDVVLILLGKKHILDALKEYYNIQHNPLGGSVFPFLSIDTLGYLGYLLIWDFALPFAMTFLSIFVISWFMGKLQELDSSRTTKTKINIAKKHEDMTKIATDKAIKNWLISNITIAQVKNTLTNLQNLHTDYTKVNEKLSDEHNNPTKLYAEDPEFKKLLHDLNIYNLDPFKVWQKIENALVIKTLTYLENFLQKITEDNFTPQQKQELRDEISRYLATNSTANPQQDLEIKK